VVLGLMGGPVGCIVCSLRCGFVRIRVSFWPVFLYLKGEVRGANYLVHCVVFEKIFLVLYYLRATRTLLLHEQYSAPPKRSLTLAV
jgi:hypothetical protein